MKSQRTSAVIWLSRFGWLVLLWSGSIVALAIVALIFRFVMRSAGMTS
ncbi:MAG TPA: DUF2474 domain-containing protein [Afipia sp.]